MKEEPHDEEELPLTALKMAPAKVPPPFPQDGSVAELLQKLSLGKDDELLFLQLPDTLPGQPPTQDSKPVKSEVQNEDGHMMVIKQEKTQVWEQRTFSIENFRSINKNRFGGYSSQVFIKTGVYGVPCECDASYVRQMGQLKSPRVTEHRRHVRLGQMEKSAIAQGC